MTAPRVSLLMTTWNGAAHIGASLDSALGQDFADYEVVVVDDASTDDTPAILRARAAADPRLRVLNSPRQRGVVGARNLGIAACRGAYVAMLDHDDLSDPGRLSAQAGYLDAHPGVVMVGTAVRMLLADGRMVGGDHPRGISPALLRWMLHTDNPFSWSSIMLRADAVRRLGCLVREEYLYADDYDLYHRLLALGDLARLDAVLVTYRFHATNTSNTKAEILNANAARVLARAFAPWFGAEAEAAARIVLHHCSDRQPPADAAELDALGAVLGRAQQGFLRDTPLSPGERLAVTAHTGRIWWRAVRGAARRGRPGLLPRYAAQPALSAGWTPLWRDRVETLGIGLLRAITRRGG